ncbi:MAG: saccharopine dehydrogenase NADP-binding domain-containing protein [Planctomycetes bacterium]|nr:saccharopine dehydrogenase NADP-binding domain-containing protein [Planctomycetota bacterium]
MSTVMVLGGSGLMGRRILRLLRQSLPDATLICGGRSPTSVEGATFTRFDLARPEDFGATLQHVDVLINTVGPFTYDHGPLLRACREHRCHYVDLAETPAFMQAVRDIAAGFVPGDIAAITGCSSVPALIEVFARRWQGRADVAGVRAQLSIGTNNDASATLLYSMLLPIGRAKPQGSRWFGESWLRDHGAIGTRRYSTYPSGLESIGVSLGDRIVPLRFGFGFDRRSYTSALRMVSRVVGATPRGLLHFGSRIGAAMSPLARPLGTRVGIMAIDALDASGDVLDSIEIIARNNGLDVPSWPSVWAAEALLAKPNASGSISLADLVTPDMARSKLVAAGFEVATESAEPALV